ncbi:hypothetical protein CISG_04178 [Coccidioides immitis RMSCC 3703]|uniref:Thymidylate synthase/dCMP hydroxymethylase domain-containing protein n=1 Tax=Coccidioides immitis RMSCC 3703 TaxID=454286 RepID=A0A0J8QT67_COCIT|nr:hypothetical protein CISG_04178 [Coccidioides immitis RMSCC 3703]
MGDAHVYRDHIAALQEQLTREPTTFPELRINRTDRGSGDMDGWAEGDFEFLVSKRFGTFRTAFIPALPLFAYTNYTQ